MQKCSRKGSLEDKQKINKLITERQIQTPNETGISTTSYREEVYG